LCPPRQGVRRLSAPSRGGTAAQCGVAALSNFGGGGVRAVYDRPMTRVALAIAVLCFSVLLAAPGRAQLPESAGPWEEGEWKHFVTFEVRERAGLDRRQEPVEAAIRLPTRNVRVVRWSGAPEEIVSQVVEAQPDGAAFRLRVVFPATVPARGTVLYRVYYGHPEPPEPAYSGLRYAAVTRVGWIVENEHFIADASERMVRDQAEDSGQLRGLTLKFAGVTLLRSTGPRMHWAPNFQRVGANSYTGMPRWHPVQRVDRSQGPVVAQSRRTGFHSEYPEIAMEGEYRFFAHVPYFLFRSEMVMKQEVALRLLRNDEMTMDGFFTHVAWPGRGRGAPPRAAPFDDRHAILEKEPIPADAPWVLFFHEEKGYGFGSVRLRFDNQNAAGKPSPLYRAETNISDGVGGGRYWNRRLINDGNVLAPAGSRYFEENAYVVFRLRPGALPEKIGEFLEWERKLRNPLVPELQGTRAWTERQKRMARPQ
jgi:hypothetical protein